MFLCSAVDGPLAHFLVRGNPHAAIEDGLEFFGVVTEFVAIVDFEVDFLVEGFGDEERLGPFEVGVGDVEG